MMDIALQEHNELDVVLGDFVIRDSALEHPLQLLWAQKGDFKEQPQIGVGIVQYIDDEDFSPLLRAIGIALVQDGMQVQSIQVTENGQLNINAHY
jgi:hypothetical protein